MHESSLTLDDGVTCGPLCWASMGVEGVIFVRLFVGKETSLSSWGILADILTIFFILWSHVSFYTNCTSLLIINFLIVGLKSL